MTRGIVLLSGGLDSLVALDIASSKMDVVLALTFDYSQKAFKEEFAAAEKICNLYNIAHQTIKLPFLSEITKNALTDENNNDFNELKSVWIPNRNGLFLNIAASFCDALDIDYIIFGANKEENGSFSDNKPEYIKISDKSFKYSTLKHPKIFAPCANMTKIDLVNYMIDNNINFSLIKSCYQNVEKSNKKHCASCMSCKLLYNAILNSKNKDLIKEIF